MAYEAPTLFGVVYAKRLFDEIDERHRAYEAFCANTAPELDLRNSDHARAMLTWLNKWGCRIDKKLFRTIQPKLSTWFMNWQKSLYKNLDLIDLTDQNLDHFGAAYGELLEVDDFGPTAASKTLFGMRPRTAVPWDALIQEIFKLTGPAPQNYRAMLVLSRREAQMIVDNAARCGVSVPYEAEGRLNTLPWLLDKYHWVTITRKHRIPTPRELAQWARWARHEPGRPD